MWLPWTCHRSIKSWESLRWHSDRWQGKKKSIFPFSLQVPTDFPGVVNSHFRHKGKDGLAFGARGWLLRCCWEEWEPQGSCLAIRGSDTKRPLYSGVRKKKKTEDGIPIPPILEVKLPRTFGLQTGIRAAAFIILPVHGGKKCFLKKNATSVGGREGKMGQGGASEPTT